MSRNLQTLIDICMFMRLHRTRSILASTSPEEEAAFQELMSSFHIDTLSVFNDDNVRPKFSTIMLSMKPLNRITPLSKDVVLSQIRQPNPGSSQVISHTTRPCKARNLAKEWMLACQFVLDICGTGPTEPSKTLDQGLMLLLPLEITEEYRTGRLSAFSSNASAPDPWADAIYALERSHSLTMSRSLQLIIDTCVFMREHRVKYIRAQGNPSAIQAIQDAVSELRIHSLSIFADTHDTSGGDASVKRMNVNRLSLVGAPGSGVGISTWNYRLRPLPDAHLKISRHCRESGKPPARPLRPSHIWFGV
ncbi:hypothetical protein CF319_g8216 [Tilletia indica]|uniref:Uncharacterized protein n=1 Tax=Tilletia indica TaxID=43049 RepID=A0A177TSW0_9BASI|nr:hypothetical protein CF319_g8216 [Tilletia indica]KAE8227851.1 hypothetical protein CF326_g7238 [Tilletia indica]KAE8250230.1 hypothetical protein A4X13_0g4881 [Tilletia indica]